jgi:Fe-S-cluster-containing hydrogenase component 2
MCIGCRLCEIECATSHTNQNQIQPTQARIRIIRDHQKQQDNAIYCHFCKNVPCIDACNYDALRLNDKIPGIETIEKNCIGCGECIEACPFEAPVLNSDSKTIIICDLCEGNPQCVKICPENAIEYK